MYIIDAAPRYNTLRLLGKPGCWTTKLPYNAPLTAFIYSNHFVLIKFYLFNEGSSNWCSVSLQQVSGSNLRRVDFLYAAKYNYGLRIEKYVLLKKISLSKRVPKKLTILRIFFFFKYVTQNIITSLYPAYPKDFLLSDHSTWRRSAPLDRQAGWGRGHIGVGDSSWADGLPYQYLIQSLGHFCNRWM